MGAFDNQRWNDYFDRNPGNIHSPGMITGGNNQNIEQQNEVVNQWVPKVRTQLRSSARWFSDGKPESMVLRGKGGLRRVEKKLAKSIESKTRINFGAIDTITFNFERHGVFVHKGVGRGFPIRGKGIIKNPSGKRRIAVEWFNPVLDKNMPKLADSIAEVNADVALNSARAQIK